MGEAARELTEEEKSLDARLKKIEKAVESKEKGEMSGLPHLSGAGMENQTVGMKYSSLENKCLTAFGCSHPAQLLKTNVNRPMFYGVDPGLKMMALSFKENIDIARYTSQILYGNPMDPDPDKRSTQSSKGGETSICKDVLESEFSKDTVIPMIKAFGTGVAGGGAEWIPTAISTQFVEEFELEKRVASMFRELPMPTNPFKLSVQKDVTIARIATEGAAMTGSNFGTTTIDFDATKFGEFYPLPEELNEDSAPAILQIARSEVAEAQIRARETAILSGDTTGPHMDADVTAADDARKAYIGLRKKALANSANGSVVDFGGAVTTPKLDEMRIAAGKFGIGVRDLGYIFSPSTYHQAVNLDEVTTVEKFGGSATIVTGTLAAFRGIPIYISEFVREDVDDNGVHTAVPAADVKGLVHLVHLRRFWVGVRRPITVRVQMDLPNQDRWLLASYSRHDFNGHAQNDKEQSTILGINVTI